MADTSLIQRIAAKIWRPSSVGPHALTIPEAKASTATGSPWRSDLVPSMGAVQAVFELFGVSADYLDAVQECTKLSEENLIFKAVIDKLSDKVAQPETSINVPTEHTSARKAAKVQRLFEALLKRVDWETQKSTLIRRMLNEGGLSWENIVSHKENMVRYIEYRPHNSIRPIVDINGHFADNAAAYRQLTTVGQQIGTFARWQIVDQNLVESSFHNRGTPHLVAARTTLSNIEMMIKGLVQKWIRSGGAIEHFNLKSATRWGDIEDFQKENKAAIEASPDALIRQFFTKGEAKIDRIVGDKSANSDVEVIDFLVELIMMSAGVPKAAFGFRSNFVIKDMADLAWQHYLQTLDKIEKILFLGLRRVFELELLFNDIIPEEVDFRIIGGEFKPATEIKVTKDTILQGAHSLNDLRRSSGSPLNPNPLFDVPGFVMTADLAEKMAVEGGVAPDWLKTRVAEREKQQKDMAALASSAAVQAASGNTDPKAVGGKRPESATKPSGAPSIPKAKKPAE